MRDKCSAPALPPLPENGNVALILSAAWSLFQERGYRGASMAEVCRRCGLTKPTLYYYFRSKAGLYQHVMARQLSGYGRQLAQPGPLAERLTSLTFSLLENHTAEIAVMLRDMEAMPDPRRHQSLLSIFRTALLGPLQEAMRAGVRGGELRPGDARLYAWTYLGLVNTFLPPRRRGRLGARTLARRLVELFLRGAGAPPQ